MKKRLTRVQRRVPSGLIALTLSLIAVSTLVACGVTDPVSAVSPAASGAQINTGPEQNRIRAQLDPAAAKLVPAAVKNRGSLVVATTGSTPPLSFHATDDRTVIGSEVDLAQLVADKLGLSLNVQLTSWESWPLKTQSGDYDAVFSNVGINAERKKLFDFAPYRAAFMGFLATTKSNLQINSAEDISGLKVAVGSGTNQEKILLAWNAQLEKEAKKPAELVNFSSASDTLLSLQAGRLDVSLQPYPSAVYQQSTSSALKIVGQINAGWPSETLVAATTAKNNGLVDALSAAINSAIKDGSYRQVLQRWGLSNEAIPSSTVVR
ncbi:ABC transporter substrate-binding protein [Psychromicrobium lacuslunae]|uniref:Amino acid-binding protein n=1 Tax=Psychromicrobium lacuslunae TaxID=1618207 RepID=A0A0D4BX12_9MICC|nr:ABC transporter substrate-binding protein [Psychromicrobium lacuslunae]AJT40863.1 amino acid-binding protein [Psychromicrobium lacuslunae]